MNALNFLRKMKNKCVRGNHRVLSSSFGDTCLISPLLVIPASLKTGDNVMLCACSFLCSVDLMAGDYHSGIKPSVFHSPFMKLAPCRPRNSGE